ARAPAAHHRRRGDLVSGLFGAGGRQRPRLLQTRAVRDGDDYVVNGQKIWTSGGHGANWIFLLARTDQDAPKHKGISFFMLDMKTPGVTVRPLINIADRHDFNEVFFEDVRISRANMIGEENRGWY